MRLYLIIIVAVLIGSGVLHYRKQIWPDAVPAAPEVGQPLPTLEVSPLSGGAARDLSSEVLGTTVINVFASWCAPCLAEHPTLIDLRKQGVRIIGLAYRDAPGDVQTYLTDNGDPYFNVLLDSHDMADAALQLDGSIPVTYVVDASGDILFIHQGPLVGTDGEAALAEIRDLTTPR